MDPAKMRKIDLDTPEELRYLIANVSAVARQKIDLHLPPAANPSEDGKPDPFRKEVEEMVMQYVHRTFNLALPSIAINAMESESIEAYTQNEESEEFEPYDRRLHAEITSLYEALEKKTLEVSTLRRNQPARAASLYAETLRKEMETDERLVTQMQKKKEEEEAESVKEHGSLRGELNLREVDRAEEVERSAEVAQEGLKKLETTLPATAHKLTRAGEALDYILKQKRLKQ